MHALTRKTPLVTERQKEIAILLSKGYSNSEVATEMGISENTVRTHIDNATTRSGAKNRLEWVIILLKRDIITLP